MHCKLLTFLATRACSGDLGADASRWFTLAANNALSPFTPIDVGVLSPDIKVQCALGNKSTPTINKCYVGLIISYLYFKCLIK